MICTDVNQEFSKGDWAVFPNPFSDRLFVRLPGESKECKYRILNMAGKEISSGILQDNENEIEVDLPAGSYFLQINRGNAVILFKKILKVE